MTRRRRAPFRLAVLCGGPSPERGISLNSARSLADHLAGPELEIAPFYFDYEARPHRVSRAQLYSNTPSDFDFKLAAMGERLTSDELVAALREVDLTFPAMHGRFGEDGAIQRLLEDAGLPFVGSGSTACARCFDKYRASELVGAEGFHTLPCLALERGAADHERRIRAFFGERGLRRAVVKPATGGSSIGVFSVGTADEALAMAERLFSDGSYQRVVVEEFCRGTEFTAVLLENRFDLPVCLLPVEIEADYTKHQIFDYRKKYLPTRQVTYHCPPRFDARTLERIQTQAEQLFRLFGLRDVARFDGWVLPDGRLWFSDFNPVSGMEQNSFLFLQAARVGLSHEDVLRFVVSHACRRYGIEPPERTAPPARARRPVHVLFGGATAERQVSLMSGANVWLKLRRSRRFEPRPFLLEPSGAVVEVPYALALNHTVEEVAEACASAAADGPRTRALRERVVERLAPLPGQLTLDAAQPRRLTLDEFVAESPLVFIGLHGGQGEDGRLQARLEEAGVPFNGSGSAASKLCMDKWETGRALAGLEGRGVRVARRTLLPVDRLRRARGRLERLWNELVAVVGTPSVVVKPVADGCSAGVARLHGARDLARYAELLLLGAASIPRGTLTGQDRLLDMPLQEPAALLVEEFVATDRVDVVGGELRWERVSGLIEVTVGVLGPKGRMKALAPSLTVASGDVLSVEEKFQGGTGINITPPPPPHVPRRAVCAAQRRIELVARTLGLEGYARVDAFMECSTGELIIIEANTLPGLTPSTVLFHQALAERRPLHPLPLLEALTELARTSRAGVHEE